MRPQNRCRLQDDRGEGVEGGEGRGVAAAAAASAQICRGCGSPAPLIIPTRAGATETGNHNIHTTANGEEISPRRPTLPPFITFHHAGYRDGIKKCAGSPRVKRRRRLIFTSGHLNISRV